MNRIARRKMMMAVASLAIVAAGCQSNGPRAQTPISRRAAPSGVRLVNPPPVAQFTDRTVSAGISHRQGSRRAGDECLLAPRRLRRQFPAQKFSFDAAYAKQQCVPERMSGGVAVGDYDNDGWPDLYFTRLDGPGVLYRNTRKGTFTDVTNRVGLSALPEPSNGAGWADIDNDGDQDLFVTTLGGHRNYLFVNESARFTEAAVVRGVADDDGTVHTGFSVNVGDYDGDGYVDIHTSEWRLPELAENLARSHNRLFRNVGAARPGFFEDVTDRLGVALETRGFGVVGFASAMTDLDRDGRVDLVAVNDFLTGRLFWNDGSTFVDGTKASGFGTEENGMGLAVGDFDGDGNVDVFVTSIFDANMKCAPGMCVHGITGNRLYANRGARLLRDVTKDSQVADGGWGWGAAMLDATNSGATDLVMTSGVDFPWEASSYQYKSGRMSLWQQQPDGSFASTAPRAGLSTPGPGKGLAILDYDRDGRTDVVVVRDGDSPVLYRNESASGASWINLDLRRAERRSAIGARVEVRPLAGGPVRTFVYGSTSGFLGQSEALVHVGLGSQRAPVAEVVVHWPGGTTSRVANVPIGRTTLLDETATNSG